LDKHTAGPKERERKRERERKYLYFPPFKFVAVCLLVYVFREEEKTGGQERRD